MFIKSYPYFKYTTTLDSYGQPQKGATKTGDIDIAIFLNAQTKAENPLYTDCEYCGKTFSNSLSTDCFITYGNEELKVQYINKAKNYFLVYMQKVK